MNKKYITLLVFVAILLVVALARSKYVIKMFHEYTNRHELLHEKSKAMSQ